MSLTLPGEVLFKVRIPMWPGSHRRLFLVLLRQRPRRNSAYWADL